MAEGGKGLPRRESYYQGKGGRKRGTAVLSGSRGRGGETKFVNISLKKEGSAQGLKRVEGHGQRSLAWVPCKFALALITAEIINGRGKGHVACSFVVDRLERRKRRGARVLSLD